MTKNNSAYIVNEQVGFAGEVRMDGLLSYYLLGDHCDHCTYITNTLRFLSLPIQQVDREGFSKLKNSSKSAILLVCDQVESSLPLPPTEFKAAATFSFLTASKLNEPIYYLPKFFNLNEFNHKFTTCKQKLADLLLNQNDLIFEKLLGTSAAINNVKKMVQQVAKSDATVLILGESGTGKDVVASCIQALSLRKNKPYIPLNCGAVPAELIESELFGHEKGAFTGAVTKRLGRFEMAQHGTLFLDEIGDMPLHMQVKLLRVLQEKSFERIGGTTRIEADVRIIAATNRNIEALIKNNQFRYDLYYRINVFPIHMPSLRERTDDIPFLIDYHLKRIQKRTQQSISLSPATRELLIQYKWPGNVRELENFLERMVILHAGKEVEIDDVNTLLLKPLPLSRSIVLPDNGEPFNISQYLSTIERETIELALIKSGGIIHAAADYLSMGTNKLIEKVKEYNLAFQA